MTVLAAGVVCWRELKGSTEVLLISRAKYNDWSFPKGKLDPEEYLPETAVREVKEETGIRVRLGRKLSTISYEIPGDKKEVHYWASKVREKDWKKKKFKPNDEVSEISWMSFGEALKKLTYKHDQKLLREVIKLAEAGELETRALILLRHAKATPRSEWKGQEAKRPLLPEGKQQAKRLVSVLGAYGPRRLITSSWRRCEQTVEPYALSCKKKLIHRSQLTELSSKESPRKTNNTVDRIFEQSKSALVCTHRPALPTITAKLASKAKPSIKADILEGTSLSPAEFLVLRLTLGENPKFVSAERWAIS